MTVKHVMGMVIASVVMVPLVVGAQAPAMKPAPAAANGSQMAAKGKTLYERLGGYDKIAKIVDTFLPKLGMADPKVGAMISGLAETSRNRNRQMIVDQICSLIGGPCVYIGRSMEAAHQGLQIDDALWKVSQKTLGDTLDELKVGEPEKSELIATIEKLRPDVVQKTKH